MYPVDDDDLEGAETVTLTLMVDPGYVLGDNVVDTVIITEDELPAVTIVATVPVAVEDNVAPGNAVFSFHRTGPTTDPLDVGFTVGGSASNGIDYSAIGTSISIPAGKGSAYLVISPIDDAFWEGDETVTLSLGGGTYVIAGTGAATAVIDDDDLRLGIGGGAGCSPSTSGRAAWPVVPLGLLTLALLLRIRRRSAARRTDSGSTRRLVAASLVALLALATSASAQDTATDAPVAPVAEQDATGEEATPPPDGEIAVPAGKEPVAPPAPAAPAEPSYASLADTRFGIRMGILAPIGGNGVAYDPGPELGFYWQRDFRYGRCALELGVDFARLVSENRSSTDDVLSGSAVLQWRSSQDGGARSYAVASFGVLRGSARDSSQTDVSTMGEAGLGVGVILRDRTDVRATAFTLLNSENATSALRLSFGATF